MNNSDITIRDILPEDAEKCAQIYHDTSIASKLPIDSTDLTDYVDYFFPFINDKDKYAVCFIKDDEIVNFLTALQIPDVYYKRTVYIDNVAVAPKHQKKGYGSKALQLFLDSLPKDTSKRLITDIKRPAYKMYENLGFMDMDCRVMEHSPLIDIMNKFKKKE